MEIRTISRRGFLKSSVITAGVITSSLHTAGHISAKIPDVNRTINMGIIGCGDRGQRAHIASLNRLTDAVRITAVCDIQEDRVDQAITKAEGKPKG